VHRSWVLKNAGVPVVRESFAQKWGESLDERAGAGLLSISSAEIRVSASGDSLACCRAVSFTRRDEGVFRGNR